MSDRHFKILTGVAIAGLALGFLGLGNFLIYGKKTLNLGSYVPWGLWVSLYLFFLGLTAGAFLITILTYGFRLRIFAGLGPLSAFTVLVVLLCEVLMIWLDLGHRWRIYGFILHPNIGSIMFWMVVFTTAMVIIYALECYFLLRENLILWSRESRPGRGVYRFLTGGKAAYSQADRDSDQARVRLLSLISLPMGLLFYAVNGAIFAVLQDRPLWNTMTPLIFILTALLSGGALITLLAYLFQPEEESIRTLGRVILLILAIFLSLEFMQFVVGYWSEAKITRASLNLILAGPYWWVFWVVHLGLGSALPLYLLISRGDEPRAVAWACFLIIFTFIAVRLNFLIPDQAIYKLEGLDTAFFHRRLQTTYAPNLTEWLVGIWVISLGLLAFLFGTRWLPVITAGKGEEEHV